MMESCSESNYNTITILNTTSEVIFIGDSTKTFTNLCLIISGFTYEQKLKLTFNNFKFSSNASAAISEPNGSCTTLEIQSIGDCSIGTTYYGGNVIDVPSEALLFAGAGDLILTAGNGADGQANLNGGNGAAAIIVNALTLNTQGTLTVIGGNGGDAYNRPAWNNGGDGSDGYAGYTGGNGGNAVTAKEVTVISSNCTIKGGVGGRGGDGSECNSSMLHGNRKGGNGGRGGSGGNALETTRLIIDDATVAELIGGAGGDGGNRGGIHPTMWGASCGEQGVGGNGGLALKVNGEQNISDQSNITCLIGDNGNPGTGTNQD